MAKAIMAHTAERSAPKRGLSSVRHCAFCDDLGVVWISSRDAGAVRMDCSCRRDAPTGRSDPWASMINLLGPCGGVLLYGVSWYFLG